MKDNQNRKIDYLRISLTDRCNLRCVYCMPEEGVPRVRHEDILTFDEILRVCRAAADLGIRKIKLTGGEPLVRRNTPELVRLIKELPGIEQVTLTTNGILLKDQMAALALAGLDGVNISLDTLDPKEFRNITRRDGLDQVLEGLHAALEVSGLNVKINCVPIAGFEEETISCSEERNSSGIRQAEGEQNKRNLIETAELERNSRNLIKIAELAARYPVHVRFIEMMPIGLGRQFRLRSEAEIREILEKEYGPMVPDSEIYGNGPSHYYSIEGFRGRIGFISAVSHKFCDKCNRIRLTSEGFLKGCLQFGEGESLRDLMRGGCSEKELRDAIRRVIAAKPEGHHFYENPTGQDEERIMSQIGG